MTGRKKLYQQGFTIVELMIATAVLSTILITVTVVMISIGNLYYKGINQARVQDAARSILDEVTQKLELSGQPQVKTAFGAGGIQAYCIDTTRYTYVVGVQINTPPVDSAPSAPPFKHVLWRDNIASADTCLTADLTADNPSLGTDAGGADGQNGAELIAPNSRLINFSINPTTSPYAVGVGVAYGDDDLLCSPSVSVAGQNSCAVADKMSALSDYTNGTLLCKGSATNGDQFCATSTLSATAVQRLTAD